MKVRIECLTWIRIADEPPPESEIVMVAGGKIKSKSVVRLPGPVPGFMLDKPKGRRWYLASKSTSGYASFAAIHNPTHWAKYPKGPTDR